MGRFYLCQKLDVEATPTSYSLSNTEFFLIPSVTLLRKKRTPSDFLTQKLPSQWFWEVAGAYMDWEKLTIKLTLLVKETLIFLWLV